LENTLLPLILLAVMLFGEASLVLLPVLPGLVIIWLAALVYGLVGHLVGTTAWLLFGGITLLMVVGSLVDNVLMGASARKTGASWASVTAALVAGMVGSLLWPPLGGIVAALLALFAVEYFRLRDWRRALVSTRSMAIGCGWAVVARFFIGLLMIGLSVAWYFAA
jgi:uncharacterized protein YqgC (DUF456 family)